jgi:hypothetical protein
MALTLMYLFGITDNSLLDWPHDAYYEAGFEPLNGYVDSSTMDITQVQEYHSLL